MMLTLGKAALETGKTKTTIAHAIKRGRLSASIGDKGQYQIDPAELFRVYPPIPSKLDHDTVDSTQTVHRELELVREQLEREREINRRLFDQLDNANDERRRLTLILEHLQEPKQKSDASELWKKVFKR
jgi:hypothetical protein